MSFWFNLCLVNNNFLVFLISHSFQPYSQAHFQGIIVPFRWLQPLLFLFLLVMKERSEEWNGNERVNEKSERSTHSTHSLHSFFTVTFNFNREHFIPIWFSYLLTFVSITFNLYLVPFLFPFNLNHAFCSLHLCLN